MKKSIIITIITIMVLGLLSWKAYPYLMIFKNPKPIEFSKEEWNKSFNNRGAMIDDLLQKYDFIGMSREEVVELLGEKGLYMGNESLRYEIGGGYLKDEVLFFSIDNNGLVKNFGIAN